VDAGATAAVVEGAVAAGPEEQAADTSAPARQTAAATLLGGRVRVRVGVDVG
jgi:hypothetical protein